MPVTHIHAYLVHPRSAEGPVEIGGATVGLVGDLFGLLNGIYLKSDNQCNIDISFNVGAGGVQQNPARDLVVSYLEGPTLERGRAIAQRLKAATDKRSGLGLLFLIKGLEADDHKFVISRFPADNGVLAELDPAGLSVEFLEQVFMKSAYSYKAAAYCGPSIPGGFWQGRAVDRQTGDPVVRLSDYWIKGFLDSDFSTTSAAGTRRLAVALKTAARSANDVVTKQAVTAAATLAPGINGQRTSMAEFQERFGLPAEVREAMNQCLRTPAASNEQFVFDAEEFTRQVAFRSVELDSGAVLTAQNADFDRVFEQEPVGDGDRIRFSTIGVVVGERLRSKATT